MNFGYTNHTVAGQTTQNIETLAKQLREAVKLKDDSSDDNESDIIEVLDIFGNSSNISVEGSFAVQSIDMNMPKIFYLYGC